MKSITVLGERRIQRLFEMAPKVFTEAMAHWLWRERRMFVGNKERQGSFQRQLGRKTRKDAGRKWRVGIGNAFKGWIDNPKRLYGMTLTMGVNDVWLKRMPYVELLNTGGTITPKRANWLIIPKYDNLRTVSEYKKYGGHGKMTFNKLFRQLYDNSDLYYMFFHGKMLYFGDFESGGKSHLNNKLLFVGVKSAKIKRQFNFERSFTRRKSGMIRRAEKMASRTVRNIDQGKLWAE